LAGKTSYENISNTIKCFQSQTYPNKELIIVNNARTQFEASALIIEPQPNILVIDTPLQFSAGLARNYGLNASNGQFIAQFDADMWHAPNRLLVQIQTMIEQEAHVSMFNAVMQYSEASGLATYYTNPKNAIPNTMVMVNPNFINPPPQPVPEYPAVEKGEELGILLKLASYKIITIPISNMICRLIECDKRIKKPINNGLTNIDFRTIKKILKTRS